jgi:hypothetical protein
MLRALRPAEAATVLQCVWALKAKFGDSLLVRDLLGSEPSPLAQLLRPWMSSATPPANPGPLFSHMHECDAPCGAPLLVSVRALVDSEPVRRIVASVRGELEVAQRPKALREPRADFAEESDSDAGDDGGDGGGRDDDDSDGDAALCGGVSCLARRLRRWLMGDDVSACLARSGTRRRRWRVFVADSSELRFAVSSRGPDADYAPCKRVAFAAEALLVGQVVASATSGALRLRDATGEIDLAAVGVDARVAGAVVALRRFCLVAESVPPENRGAESRVQLSLVADLRSSVQLAHAPAPATQAIGGPRSGRGSFLFKIGFAGPRRFLRGAVELLVEGVASATAAGDGPWELCVLTLRGTAIAGVAFFAFGALVRVCDAMRGSRSWIVHSASQLQPLDGPVPSAPAAELASPTTMPHLREALATDSKLASFRCVLVDKWPEPGSG